MTLWYARCERDELLRILSLSPGRSPTLRLDECDSKRLPYDAPKRGELLLVWDTAPKVTKAVPAAVVVPNGEVRDFLAWTWTYFPAFRPFTSFCRVLATNDARRLSNLPQPNVSAAWLNLAVGASLGEVLTYLGDRAQATKSLIPSNLLASLSTCLARAAVLGYSPVERREIAERWEWARLFFGNPRQDFEPRAILAAWEIALDTSDEPSVPVRALLRQAFEHLSKGEYSQALDVLRSFGHPTLEAVDASLLLGSRERRLGVVERSLDRLALSNGDFFDNLLAGYFTSLLSGGSLSHTFLLDAHRRSLPGAVFWYGVFAAASADGALMTEMEGLGLRLQRELLRPAAHFERPDADVAFDELRMINDGGVGPVTVPTFSPGVARVELVPGVVVSVRHSRGDRTSTEPEIAPLPAAELRIFADQLRAMSGALDGLLGGPSLPASPPSKKGSKRERH